MGVPIVQFTGDVGRGQPDRGMDIMNSTRSSSLGILIALLLVAGCGQPTSQPGDFATPSPAEDDPTDEPPPPEELTLTGTVVDRETGVGIPGVMVDGVVSGEDGAFTLILDEENPIVLDVDSDMHTPWSITFDRETVPALDETLEIGVWTLEAGLAWHEETFDDVWDEGLGVVLVHFRTPEPHASEGLAAEMVGDHYGTFVFDSERAASPGTTIPATAAVPWVAFNGVPPGEATVQVFPHPGWECNGPTTGTVGPRRVTQLFLDCFNPED